MKNVLITIFILFTINVYAIDIQPYWDLGDAKLGGVFQKQKPKADFNTSFSIVKVGFYDFDTGLSFTFNPLFFDIGTVIKNDKNPKGFYMLSVINTELAFNTLYKIPRPDKYALNLFADFHVVDPLEITRFQLNVGIEFAITSIFDMNTEKLFVDRIKLFSIRTGFRYMQNSPTFFIDIGTDLGFALAFLKPDVE